MYKDYQVIIRWSFMVTSSYLINAISMQDLFERIALIVKNEERYGIVTNVEILEV